MPGPVHIAPPLQMCWCPAPPQRERGGSQQPLGEQECCRAVARLPGAGTGKASRLPPASQNLRGWSTKQDVSGSGGDAPCEARFDGERDFFSTLLPKPLPARSQSQRCKQQGRAKLKRLFRFNMQSPGSSIKQQKLNVISSHGTATLLTKQNRLRLMACHLCETPGMERSHSLGKS